MKLIKMLILFLMLSSAFAQDETTQVESTLPSTRAQVQVGVGVGDTGSSTLGGAGELNLRYDRQWLVLGHESINSDTGSIHDFGTLSLRLNPELRVNYAEGTDHSRRVDARLSLPVIGVLGYNYCRGRNDDGTPLSECVIGSNDNNTEFSIEGVNYELEARYDSKIGIMMTAGALNILTTRGRMSFDLGNNQTLDFCVGANGVLRMGGLIPSNGTPYVGQITEVIQVDGQPNPGNREWEAGVESHGCVGLKIGEIGRLALQTSVSVLEGHYANGFNPDPIFTNGTHLELRNTVSFDDINGTGMGVYANHTREVFPSMPALDTVTFGFSWRPGSGSSR